MSTDWKIVSSVKDKKKHAERKARREKMREENQLKVQTELEEQARKKKEFEKMYGGGNNNKKRKKKKNLQTTTSLEKEFAQLREQQQGSGGTSAAAAHAKKKQPAADKKKPVGQVVAQLTPDQLRAVVRQAVAKYTQRPDVQLATMGQWFVDQFKRAQYQVPDELRVPFAERTEPPWSLVPGPLQAVVRSELLRYDTADVGLLAWNLLSGYLDMGPDPMVTENVGAKLLLQALVRCRPQLLVDPAFQHNLGLHLCSGGGAGAAPQQQQQQILLVEPRYRLLLTWLCAQGLQTTSAANTDAVRLAHDTASRLRFWARFCLPWLARSPAADVRPVDRADALHVGRLLADPATRLTQPALEAAMSTPAAVNDYALLAAELVQLQCRPVDGKDHAGRSGNGSATAAADVQFMARNLLCPTALNVTGVHEQILDALLQAAAGESSSSSPAARTRTAELFIELLRADVSHAGDLWVRLLSAGQQTTVLGTSFVLKLLKSGHDEFRLYQYYEDFAALLRRLHTEISRLLTAAVKSSSKSASHHHHQQQQQQQLTSASLKRCVTALDQLQAFHQSQGARPDLSGADRLSVCSRMLLALVMTLLLFACTLPITVACWPHVHQFATTALPPSARPALRTLNHFFSTAIPTFVSKLLK